MDIYKKKWTTLQSEIFSLMCVKSGDKMSQREIAKYLKVSPTAIANSLDLLEKENLIKVEKNRSMNLISLNPNERKVADLKRVENFLASVTGLFNEVKSEEKNSLNVVETSRLPFTLRIKNIDIYHIKPEGKLSIFKANGDLALETKISKTTILPGKIRKFPVELKPELPQRIKKYLPASASDFISKNILWGKYKAVLSLSAENKKLEQSIEFWAFPWRFWLSTGLAIAVLTLFLVKWKNRIWLASKALLKRS